MNFNKTKESVRNIQNVVEATLAAMEAGRAREFAGIPPELVEQIEAAPNREFFQRAAALIPEGREHELPQVGREYVLALRNRIAREREPGGLLRIARGADEVTRVINLLRDYLYRAAEQDALEAMLEAGERIVGVDFGEIRTAKRALTRTQLREHGRGPGFVEDAEIEDAIKAKARREELRNRPFSSISGPNVPRQ